jgi:hypothetical protein
VTKDAILDCIAGIEVAVGIHLRSNCFSVLVSPRSKRASFSRKISAER